MSAILNGAQLALLLDEAAHAAQFSLAAALRGAGGQPHPRIGWLTTHLSVRKRECWAAISGVADVLPVPPELNLSALCRWEVEQAARLSADELARTVDGQTVAALLRLNVRHTLWHAGQIAALTDGPRLA